MTGATVLIADDSEVVRAVVRAGLEHEGYRVIEEVDGRAALEHCRHDPPDTVLLDIEMPELDGYQVLSALKGDDELKDIPVVFLTGRSDVADVVAGLRAGAHDYLRKPFENIELLARVGSAVHVKRLQDQLRQRNADLDRMSRTDALTGLHNRRHLDEELLRQRSIASRHRDPLSVMILDIDHFKRINDSYGHPVGDRVLRAFADLLRAELRVADVAGRWGGEEFLIIMPRTDIDGAFEVGERLRRATAAKAVPVGDLSVSVTVSGGCAVSMGQPTDALLRLADACLYQAKASGRDKIVRAALPTMDSISAEDRVDERRDRFLGSGHTRTVQHICLLVPTNSWRLT